MIFVTVGTDEHPFDRLLSAVASLSRQEELYVQHGPSLVRPPGATSVDYVPFEEMVALTKRARVVISHAGVGSLLVALGAGKRPVIMPRLRRAGEHVDDHQVLFAVRLGEAGLAAVVKDAATMQRAVREATGLPPVRLEGLNPLVEELRAFLREEVGVPGDDDA